MIHYDLQCGDAHRFDGWFKDSASFDMQAESGLLECPTCGDRKVSRALMAPAVPKRRRRQPLTVTQTGETVPDAPAAASQGSEVRVPDAAVPGPSAGPNASGRLPDHLRAMLQRLRAEVEKTCDYVGPDFAEEARRIHRGESDARAIYGEASKEQAEALLDDGIEVMPIPWVPRADG
jgi:hypothetical protein